MYMGSSVYQGALDVIHRCWAKEDRKKVTGYVSSNDAHFLLEF